jgi:hypothetical protein
MKKYLSHGMGINSTALMLLLEDENIEFESVFVNHGGDYPETYEYVDYLKAEGYNCTVLIPDYCGCHTIEEYALKYNLFPGFKFRWCTINFKIKVLHKYYKKPCVDYIGIAADEECRVKNHKHFKGIITEYPLIQRGINRKDCIRIIKEHGLKVPRRSGCWCCPFMPKTEVRRLFLEEPELYKRRKHLEESVIFRGEKIATLSCTKRTVKEMGMENIAPLIKENKKER